MSWPSLTPLTLIPSLAVMSLEMGKVSYELLDVQQQQPLSTSEFQCDLVSCVPERQQE